MLPPTTRAAKILFVTTGSQPNTVKFENILQAQGHDLTIHDTTVSGNADTATNYAAQGYDLLIVDEVISSGAVGDRFRNSPIPVINWEGFIYSTGRSSFNAGATGETMTGGTFSNAVYAVQQDAVNAADYGQVQNTTAINIIDPDSPLAAGLSAGEVNVFDPNAPPPAGTPGDGSGVISFAGARTFITNVQVAATVPGFANGYCVWGVDAGAINADGTTNQARWVHLPWNDSDPARVIIEPSFFLFEAAVAWTLHLPEPTKIYRLTGGNVNGTNQVTFSADKVTHSGSAVVQSDIKLIVNGVDVTSGATIVSDGAQWDVSYTGLDKNQDYTAVASATAADGGFSARMVSFNTFPEITFDPSYYTMEAEDFNFGGGMFFDTITLCNTIGGGTPGCYYDRIGFTNIDQLELDFSQTVVVPAGTETYRFGDTADIIRDEWVDTYLTADPLIRPQYTAAEIPDYEVRGITNGEWLNYTRTVPATNYNIYARVSSSGPLDIHMDFVTSGATTTNQTLQSVGDFIRPTGTVGEWKLVPLTDDSGTNLIVVPFDGTTKTMRFTALSSGYNENFFMFVPTAAQIKPIVTITSPAKGSLLKEGEPITVEAEAQDPDGSVSQVQFFAGTNEPLASIGVDSDAPFTASFTPPALGVFATYTIRAVATDNNGNTSQNEINITTQPPSTLPPAGKLANIVWVTFHPADDAPSTDAATAGFTNAPDKDYTDLLTANGYNVTRYVTTGTPDPAILDAADLVIIGRSINSSDFANAGADAWNNITTPMIIMAGYTLRNNRMGFTTNNNMVDITNNVTLTVNNPAHPIFAGITLTGDTMANPFAGLANYPDGVTFANPPRGISINTDLPDDEGTVLATISAAGGGPVGAMIIGEWPAGAMLTHAGGAGTNILAGHRLVFLSGSREGDSVDSETAGLFDLTADGTQMFLNAVAYMLHPEPYKVAWVTFHPADNTPATDAATAGFTNAPDKGYTDLLTANGYQVTRYVSSSTPDAATLNAADVVIIGRSINSGDYAGTGATAWNSITAPVIVMAGYTLRANRMGFVTASTTPVDTTNSIALTVSDPTHYIFHGIPLTDDTMDNPFAGLAIYPPDVVSANPPRGISITTDPVNAGGTVLATVQDDGNPAGGMVIGEWQPGVLMADSTQDVLAGPRVVFLSGSREADGITSQSAGIYDLTADGAQMFLNAVRYAASRKREAVAAQEFRIGSVSVENENQLRLNIVGGTGSFVIQMKTSLTDSNWMNISTNSGSSVLVPIGTGNAFFRLMAQ